MSTEANKPNILLRSVKREPAAAPKSAEKTGVLFERVAETRCPHCDEVVPLADAEPLSSVPCPACGGRVLVPGRVGGFLLHGHIGEGEMGSVYRATDESLRRDVAVKLVRGCLADDPESRERLQSEACAAGKLNHPSVAQVYALNFSNGHPYLVMELVTGQDFAHTLEREGRIAERDVLRMALDVADGLSALNREGLVHGDIKPGNIVLDRDGNAKLVDFGLSGMTRLDSRGALVGTPNYIAPELLKGAKDTHRSDLYSLGATLYHLLAGRPPSDGEKTIDVLKARLLRRPAALGLLARHVSQPTQKLIMRMLDPDPEKRPANSDAVAAEIRKALDALDAPKPAAGASAEASTNRFDSPSLPLPPPPPAPPRRRGWVTLVLALIAAVEIAVAIREQSFYQTWLWLRRAAAPSLAAPALPDSQTPTEPAPEPDPHAPPLGPATPPPRPEAAAPVSDDFTVDAKPVWQSMNLGADTPRGSTLQMGGTLIIQGAGKDMLKGHDRCRLVWTRTSGNYAFSAQVKAIADTHSSAVTGLLVKGDDPALGPGLLFGLLGSGELFLQVRQENHATVLVKRSEQPLLLPSHLKLLRSGNTFQAYVSSDGQRWDAFAACELDLPPGNSLGFAVSSQDPSALATAKFASISLRVPKPPHAAPSKGAPAATHTTNEK